MNPLMWLRIAGAAGLLAGLYGGYQYIHHGGVVQGRAEVQAKFDKYKGEINDQVQKANEKAATIKLVQDAKAALAKSDYANLSRDLNAALARLRKPQTVPGNSSVPVAGSGVSPMPPETGNSSGITPAVEVAAGACEGTEFWENALKDTLQCSRLIEFVTP